MHIMIATDQHPESLGGAQVSIRLQKKFLEKAGHQVTIVAPGMHREHPRDPCYVELPSFPITFDREYALTRPGRRSDRTLDAEMARRGPVDVVHIQGDFWGAVIGLRFARRHGIPVVLTFHNNMEFGLRKTVPFPKLATKMLLSLEGRSLGGQMSLLRPDAWRYLNELALRADAVTAPSNHFAALLRTKGVAQEIDVVRTGADDDVIDDVLAGLDRDAKKPRPSLVWMGRMSHEKRILEFLQAVKRSGVNAEVRLYGQGLLLSKAREFVAKHKLRDRVVFVGKVPYRDALAAIANADALAQTSIGFETQGMTVFEAAALGTTSIVCDPQIAAELPEGVYAEPENDSIDALAATITRVVDSTASGELSRPSPSAAETLRQSAQTARMIEIYERVTA
ncbi:glycosyltransferase [Paramicrobacterium chengjingii]|uniref:Glycosyltransferase n=2 Tax=Paramicrobacterium chengjingii TaxID=2769067 RepID=A0ABX6YG71_9MICO|nr:glycosyltransferase [Microbacterium chengjingii]QPZ37776.1 glycosyltransferase [Microbacterium chengjingii]